MVGLPIAVILFCGRALAADRVRYTVSLANLREHRVEVTIEIPPGRSERELQLPVWNALYQVRDFSQYMNWIRAATRGGQALVITQLTKSRWKITGTEGGARAGYEMFSDDPGPYGAQLNSHHAFFNLAEILCYLEGERGSPADLEFRDVPAGWKVATPLDQRGRVFSADNYDQLVDSPVEIGAFEEKDFQQACGEYRVLVDAERAQAILDTIVPPIQRIVSTETNWMNDCPFERYMFIYHFGESPGGGGMEHAYSTAITLAARDLSENFDDFTRVTAHEFFHLWNVKRIRPQSLEPIDYTKENYTPALWFSEGVDTTVAEYVRLRAGFVDEPHYLEYLSRSITELESRPAHLTQSAEQSSLDAWLERYPYYNLPARSISYYNKGELLGVLLDLKMRESTNDQVSLRELFRWMNEHYAKQGKFFADSDGVRQAAEALTHSSFGDFFHKEVSGVDEIPWNDFFKRVGLHLVTSEVISADAGFQAARNFDQPFTVVEIQPGSNADLAGLKLGDLILEVNGEPPARDLERTLEQLAPGELLHLRVRRDGSVRELEWKLDSRKRLVFRLQDVPDLTSEQRSRRAAWLFGDAIPQALTVP